MLELRAGQQHLHVDLKALNPEIADCISVLCLAETLIAFNQRLRDSAENLEIAERQRIVRLLVKNVLVDDDTIVIRHAIALTNSPTVDNQSPPTSSSLQHGIPSSRSPECNITIHIRHRRRQNRAHSEDEGCLGRG
jgi:site-specific DNA recombinase